MEQNAADLNSALFASPQSSQAADDYAALFELIARRENAGSWTLEQIASELDAAGYSLESFQSYVLGALPEYEQLYGGADEYFSGEELQSLFQGGAA